MILNYFTVALQPVCAGMKIVSSALEIPAQRVQQLYSALVYNNMANPALKLKDLARFTGLMFCVTDRSFQVIEIFSRQRTIKNILVEQLICMKHPGPLSQHSLAEPCCGTILLLHLLTVTSTGGTLAQPEGHWHRLSNTDQTNPALVQHHSNQFNTSPTRPRPAQWPLTSPALAEANHSASKLKTFTV